MQICKQIPTVTMFSRFLIPLLHMQYLYHIISLNPYSSLHTLFYAVYLHASDNPYPLRIHAYLYFNFIFRFFPYNQCFPFIVSFFVFYPSIFSSFLSSQGNYQTVLKKNLQSVLKKKISSCRFRNQLLFHDLKPSNLFVDFS